MNNIEYVKQIKQSNWEVKDTIDIDYVIEFMSILEEVLNPSFFDQPNYLNNLFPKIIKSLCTKWKIVPNKGQIVEAYLKALQVGKIKSNPLFESMIIVKATRSNSGELETTTTLPGIGMSCKYDCAMCPNQPGMPRSYLASEGSIIQAIVENFDSFSQVLRRFILYEYKMGHTIDKVLHILLGGTFHSYDEEVIEKYITNLYYCSNIYQHFSIRNNGKYVSIVKEWLKLNPFMNHISVNFGPLGDIIKTLRPIQSLAYEKSENTYSICGRITGIVIETRPDQISYKTMYDLRRYGVTRVQLGIQHTDESILKIMERQHSAIASAKGIKYLRDNGFKIDGHLMPNCPGSTNEKDLLMLKEVFEGEDLQLDYCKLYICLDVMFTKIREWKERAKEMQSIGLEEDLLNIDRWMKEGDFNAIQKYAGDKKKDDVYVWIDRAETEYEQFLEFLLKSIEMIPPWTRLNRFQRDFPEATEKNQRLGYESTTLRTNLQQICMDTLKERGLMSYDIRSREIRKRIFGNLQKDARIYIRKYRANDGLELFISIEVPNSTSNIDDAIILGFIRLRIPDWDLNKSKRRAPSHFLNIYKKAYTLRVRELHVYGTLQSVRGTSGNSQHLGIGKFLLKVADYVAYIYKLEQIAIISGVGVQDYYRKNGYKLTSESDGEYMVKSVQKQNLTKSTLFGNNYNFYDFYYALTKNYTPLLTNVKIEQDKNYKNRSNLVVIKHKKHILIIYLISVIALILIVLFLFRDL